MYHLYNFSIYSILGFIIEIIFKFIINNNLETGIMFGPYTPVYGIGITVIYFLFDFISKKVKNKCIVKYCLFFLTSFLLLTLFEYLGGKYIEILFHDSLWNYKNYKFNIGKYICLEMSLCWSFISILVYLYLKPITDKLFFKTNKNIIKLFILIMFVDSIFTTILKLK